jgi:RND family efflux transporter MFP subunit
MRLKRVRKHPVRRTVKQAAALALSVALLAGCSGNEPAQTAAAQSGSGVQQLSVKVETVGRQKVSDQLLKAGDILPSAQFDLQAKTGGIVEKIWKKRGDMVQEGDLLLTLSNADAESQKESAELAVQTVQNSFADAKVKAAKDLASNKQALDISIQRAQMNVDDATRSYNKTRNDYDDGLANTDQVLQAEKQLKSAQMDLGQLKSQRAALDQPQDSYSSDFDAKLKDAQMLLQQAQKVVDSLQIKAPMSGILTEFPSEAGVTLPDGAKVGVLQKLDPVLIRTQLADDEARVVRMKKEVPFTVQGGGSSKAATAQIRYLANVMDAQTKSYELDLEVGNKDLSLMPGYRVQLQLTNDQDTVALAVPTYSLIKEGDDSFVYVVADGKASKRKVQLGRLYEPYQEVLSGVSAGDKVIVSGLSKLHDQEQVTVAAAPR